MINLPIGILSIALILRYAQPTTGLRAPMNAWSQVSAALCVATLCFAVTEASSSGWTGQNVGVAMIALASGSAFILNERRMEHPMLPGRLFKNPIVLAMLLSGVATNLAFFGAIFGMSLYFQDILHFTVAQTGLSFVPMTAVLAVSSLISARIGRSVSGTWIIFAGFSISTVGFLMLARITTTTPVLTLDLILMLIGVGIATATPSMMNMMISSVSHRDAGIASGLMSSGRQLGGVVGVAMFGALIDHPDSAAFLTGLSRAVLLSAAALLLCVGLNAWASRSVDQQPHG
ncbi:MFS transporter [Roseomonas gilardii]|uniref:MFS transporter n=1 Tax=Roseomonas gilardii TaxID=257708 RepID=A0ABU3MKL9_9PROT|nr:MFS transporter [Roseomonas gilardii]MDT8332875.1 MFS transporter [Roseomonas gilardii]